MDRKVVIMDHPLIQHKLSILRDVDTSTMEFRELVNEIAMLMMYDATRDLPLEDKQVTTPCGVADCKVLAGRKLAFVPILRAGLGMVDGALRLVPAARVGHIGLYRNEETLEPVEYYCKLPGDIGQRDVFVLDPMLATGGSAIDAITQYEILNELLHIKENHNTAMIFISHDLNAISRVADRIVVLNHGAVVDRGDFRHILHHAQDPYTKLLVEKRADVMRRYTAVLNGKKEAAHA